MPTTYNTKNMYYPRKRYYKKKYKKRERMPRKKQPTWQKLAGAVVKYGPSVASTVARMYSMINSELKYVDNVQVAPLPILSTGTFYNLTDTNQGDTQTERNGISQLNHNLIGRMVGWMDPTGAPQQYFRYIIFVWKDNASQNPPTVADILESPNNPMTSPLNIEESEYFSVIRDKTIVMTTNSSSSAYDIKEFIKLNPLHSKYASTTAASATFDHVFLLLLSDTTTNAPFNAFDFRVRYYDN